MENSLEKLESNETIKPEDHLPLSLRNPFQITVFKMLISEKMLDETDMVGMEKYGKMISDYIDNPANIEERELIIDKKFVEAAGILMDQIKKEESLSKAA